jgi:outer membrane protein insertion porin family
MRRGLVSIAFVAFAALGAEAFAQGVLREIRVEGNQRIEADTVRSYMSIAPGDLYDRDKIDRSLKALFGTSLFADVNMRQEGDAIVVRVVENPVINRIAFEGNKRFESKLIEPEIQLRPRVVYTRTRVQSDVQRILQMYRRNGRFAATVEPKIIQLAQNRVDLVFEINEGDKTGIRKINFIGNKRFADKTLRDRILTRETRWYRFLTADDIYDPDRLTVDRERLRKFYLSKGHADFRVVSAIAELTPDRESFFLTFAIDEGDVYRFGEVKVENELKTLHTPFAQDLVRTKPGEIYNADDVEGTVQDITTEVTGLGLAFVDVVPEIKRDREKRIIDVTYKIAEGPRIYVERIDITGNVRTLDKVVRREFRFVEGDAFNSARIRRSRQRLQSLGFFDKVDIKTEKGSAPDKTVVAIDVRERSTGELSIGVGFSTSDGVLGDVSIRERNFLGKGQDVKLGYTLSTRRRQADFAFTEPYFLDKHLGAGLDLMDRERDLQSERSYDEHTKRGRVRFGHAHTEFLSQSYSYLLQSDTIENVGNNASRFIKRVKGSTTTSEFGQRLTYDRRDDKLNPTDGYVASLGTEYAGIGGEVNYVRLSLDYSYYYPYTDDTTLVLTAASGYILGLGEDVRISNRFFIGGNSFRGFRSGGIGPRDLQTGDALGGNLYYLISGEGRFPIGLPKELGVQGRYFVDTGSLSKVDESGTGIGDTASLRVSTGVGMTWATPLGPLAIDFGRPLVKESYDRTETFRISFGTRF